MMNATPSVTSHDERSMAADDAAPACRHPHPLRALGGTTGFAAGTVPAALTAGVSSATPKAVGGVTDRIASSDVAPRAIRSMVNSVPVFQLAL